MIAAASTLSPSISTLPAILMVHLKRLAIGKKIQRQVEFDVEFDLNPYMTVKGEPLIYALIGVIEHIGNHEAGNYIAFTEGRQLRIGATTPLSPRLPCTTS